LAANATVHIPKHITTAKTRESTFFIVYSSKILL